MRIFLLIITFLLSFESLTASATDSSNPVNRFSFELQGNFIIIKAILNGSTTDTANFLFDTGATTTVIDSAFLAKSKIKTKLKKSLAITASGLTKISNAKIKSLSINNINVFKKGGSLSVIDLSKFESLNIVGIIGYDILCRYIVSVDFNDKIMQWHSFDETPSTSDYERFNFELSSFIPIPKFPIKILTESNEQFTGDVLFDTGADLSLLLNQSFIDENGLSTKLVPIAEQNDTARSLNNAPLILRSARISNLSLGNFEFKELTIRLPSDNKKSFSVPNFIGILGLEIIRKTNFIIDYNKKSLYLKQRLNL